MKDELLEIEKEFEEKELYDYQVAAIDQILERLRNRPDKYNLLYQLPTGGGKTVIFSEITKRYIRDVKKKVLILTHRIELCGQTSNMLNEFGIQNKIIESNVKEISDQGNYMCFVAMVETLNNRMQDEEFRIEDIGLVIIDEAHYNSFKKLFQFFGDYHILGVTATPLSSNVKLPMKDNYDELIIGDSISALIEKKFLSRATTYSYDVNLRTLKIGANGDYTVSSSELLYSNNQMIEKLIYAYEEKSKGKKTLIFNNGIKTSEHVCIAFEKAGYPIKHLDNTATKQERKNIIHWFKTTPDAILTSVGILTTGFDEPTVETIILNRATRSLTLYFQMIGRGSRILPNKSTFLVLDLGNNAARFGLWDAPVNWYEIFTSPDYYYENLLSDFEIERQFKYTMPAALRAMFSKSESIEFNVKEEYLFVSKQGYRPKVVLENSVEQHARMCIENADTVMDALHLALLLDKDIEYRIRRYSYCICNSTDNYIKWLKEDYHVKLSMCINRKFDGSKFDVNSQVVETIVESED